MLTREELLDVGVGSLDDVCAFHAQQHGDGGVINSSLSDLGVAIKAIPQTPAAVRAVSALLCALANRDLEKSGYLYSLDKTGCVNRSYLSAGAERSIIAAAVCN